jgi:uncharacterized protein
MAVDQLDASEIVALLELKPHPEGGWYRQTFCDDLPGGKRANSTSIYYLLQAGERSHWHRVDAAEIWHFYAGAPLELLISPDGQDHQKQILGLDFMNGQRPQLVVPAAQWQSATSLGAWTLAGCTVSPGFEFSGFEMADKGWEPGHRTNKNLL